MLNPKNRNLLFIFLLGFLLRLIYLIWGADKILGSGKFIMGDTYGWVLSFKNLVEHGIYSFDLANPEAAFGRVPGFAFFWGIHYLLFPDNAYKAVAVTQTILDSIAIILIYKIAINVYRKELVALFAALLYAFYPFVIAWITVSYSELLANFTTLLVLAILTKPDKKTIHYFLIGLLCAVAFFVREFMGILLPISLATIFFIENTSITHKTKKLALVTFSFLLLYSIWPIRNYVNHNRLVLARTSGGFVMYNSDFQAFRAWVNTWDADESAWVNAVSNSEKPVNFPRHIFNSDKEAKKAAELVTLARTCGSSFMLWKSKLNGSPINPNMEDCNEQIKKGFDELRFSLIKNQPLFFFTYVPAINLYKAIFKNNVQKGSVIKNKTARLMGIAFLYRSFLILLGLIGILLSVRNKRILPLAGFSISIYFLLCFIIRFLEMRNLLQADTVLLIPAAFTVYKLLSFVQFRRQKLNPV